MSNLIQSGVCKPNKACQTRNASQENMTPPTLTASSSHGLWREWDRHMRFQLDAGPDLQTTGCIESLSESWISQYAQTVSAFCLLWEEMKLMRAPLTEVVAVSSDPLKHKPKKKRLRSHKRTSVQSFMTNRALAASRYARFTHWMLVGKEKRNQWWLHDLLWPLRSRVQTEQLRSWHSLQRMGGSAGMCAASRPTTPERPAVRRRGQEEPFRPQAKAFPTALQVCPHLKVNHMIKVDAVKSESWPGAWRRSCRLQKPR